MKKMVHFACNSTGDEKKEDPDKSIRPDSADRFSLFRPPAGIPESCIKIGKLHFLHDLCIKSVK
jgi:hypothetical protein